MLYNKSSNGKKKLKLDIGFLCWCRIAVEAFSQLRPFAEKEKPREIKKKVSHFFLVLYTSRIFVMIGIWGMDE